MIDGLGPQARALLDAAREGLSPDAAAVQRVREQISVATGGAAAGTALGVKLGVVVLVGAIAVGIGFLAILGSGSEAPRREPAVMPAPVPPPAPQDIAAPEVPAPASDDELITIETQAAPPAPPVRPVLRGERVAPGHRAPPAGQAGAQGAEPARPPPGPTRAGIDLAREVELVDRAMLALRRGDARAALEAVRRHTVETGGRGQLAEDAAAIEIEALCRLRDPSTRARLDAFDARFPRSAQRSRLTASCP
jgi:hypothetical protein